MSRFVVRLAIRRDWVVLAAAWVLLVWSAVLAWTHYTVNYPSGPGALRDVHRALVILTVALPGPVLWLARRPALPGLRRFQRRSVFDLLLAVLVGLLLIRFRGGYLRPLLDLGAAGIAALIGVWIGWRRAALPRGPLAILLAGVWALAVILAYTDSNIGETAGDVADRLGIGLAALVFSAGVSAAAILARLAAVRTVRARLDRAIVRATQGPYWVVPLDAPNLDKVTATLRAEGVAAVLLPTDHSARAALVESYGFVPLAEVTLCAVDYTILRVDKE